MISAFPTLPTLRSPSAACVFGRRVDRVGEPGGGNERGEGRGGRRRKVKGGEGRRREGKGGEGSGTIHNLLNVNRNYKC